jgi:rod shape determining protein RodA
LSVKLSSEPPPCKEYQYERLNPNTYHQKAGETAISLGSLFGSGWCKSEYTGKKWLPFGHTDSVFCVFAEEFGLVGAIFLLSLFFALIYFIFWANGWKLVTNQ